MSKRVQYDQTRSWGGWGTSRAAVIVVLLIVACLADAMLIHPASAQPSTDWPMFRFNSQHAGATQSVTPPLELEWNYTTGGCVYSSPAVSGDFVYVGSYDGKIYALYAANGTRRWSYATGFWAVSSPAVSGGVVYVGSWKVYALGASTGTLNWSYVTKGGNVYSSPAVSGGVVYVGSDDDNIYALNAYTGARIWNYTTGGLVESSPAVSGGFVYVGSYDRKVYAFSPSGPQTRYSWPMFQHDITHTGYCESPAPRTNHTMWNYTTGFDVGSSPAVANGKVYVGSYDNNVYALNASTGVLVWNYTTGGPVSSSPAVANGEVYVGSYDNTTYCLDVSTGIQVWNYTTHGWILSSPAVADGKVYVGSLDYETYCLDASTGLQVWNYTTGDFVYSSPAIADGMVFIGSADFTLYAFGEIIRTEDYNTVQEAINAAPPEAIVLVAPGIYNQYLVINTTLTILGRLGSEPTFYGGGSGIAITIVASASRVTIAGITITNYDQGILVNGASGCKICNNIMSLIRQNGITLQGSNASNTVVYSNIFEEDAIAVSLTSSSSNNIIYGNVISLSSIGLDLQSSGNIVYANIMTYNVVAININNSNNNKFFHNNFSNFTLNMSNSTGNVWDDGYPSGGNYWSDYHTKYPNATENGSSGIWDTPYVVATNNVDHYPLAKPFSLHNIGTASLIVSKTVIGQSYTPPMSVLQISLKILNLGTYDETFTLTVRANSTLIIEQTVSLSREDYTTFTLTWNTAGCVIGNYTISATAGPVPSEADTFDNSRSSWVVVTIPGDVKGDFVVDILDAILLSNAFNSYPGQPNWNPNADIKGDNIVDILDAIILSTNFNQHYP